MAKKTVESSWVLDAIELARGVTLVDGASGTCPVTRDGNTGRISWALEEDANRDEFLHVFYTATAPHGRESQGSEWILLERTRASVGRERVWFACPCCERRVRKLYLPSSSRSFWCRNCHHLSYRTRQRRLRPFEQMLHLQRQLQVLPVESSSWRHKARELERVEESVPALGPMPSYEDLVRPYEAPPKRRRGRPSKAQERERARIEREAAQALTLKRPPGRPKVKRPYTRRTPFRLRESMSESDAFCVKCRDRREIKEPRAVSLANGRSALQGACPVCKTLLTRIVKAERQMPGPEATSAPAKRPRGRPRLVRPAPLPDRASTPDSQGYCMKCRVSREIEDPEAVTLANGRSALEGACPVCGTHMIRIVKAKKTDQE